MTAPPLRLGDAPGSLDARLDPLTRVANRHEVLAQPALALAQIDSSPWSVELRALPIDQIKLDRSFVGGLGDGSADAALAAGLLPLARALGIEVAAEGSRPISTSPISSRSATSGDKATASPSPSRLSAWLPCSATGRSRQRLDVLDRELARPGRGGERGHRS